LKNLGIEVYDTDRGGKVTYHGLGQLVGYPIISLSPDREDVHRYVRDIEEVLIRTMADFSIDAFRIEGLTGVHTSEGKIAAIGVHIKRWVTTHGFALNVNTDLSYYNWIIACEGEPVTSMERILGREVELADVEDRLIVNFENVFGYEAVQIPKAETRPAGSVSVCKESFMKIKFFILSISLLLWTACGPATDANNMKLANGNSNANATPAQQTLSVVDRPQKVKDMMAAAASRTRRRRR
jgi:lipoate-protein ligase B